VADERKFKQILLNLLSNAVKFTPAGGRITLGATQDGEDLLVSVRDTGIGIAQSDQAAIFEEFRQVVSDIDRKREGTGLGLSLVRRFAELHGGSVAVESVPGQGATFTVRLPRCTL
jgi:signal transduction histidine kinase